LSIAGLGSDELEAIVPAHLPLRSTDPEGDVLELPLSEHAAATIMSTVVQARGKLKPDMFPPNE
jgi:hypothetical protein